MMTHPTIWFKYSPQGSSALVLGAHHIQSIKSPAKALSFTSCRLWMPSSPKGHLAYKEKGLELDLGMAGQQAVSASAFITPFCL